MKKIEITKVTLDGISAEDISFFKKIAKQLVEKLNKTLISEAIYNFEDIPEAKGYKNYRAVIKRIRSTVYWRYYKCTIESKNSSMKLDLQALDTGIHDHKKLDNKTWICIYNVLDYVTNDYHKMLFVRGLVNEDVGQYHEEVKGLNQFLVVFLNYFKLNMFERIKLREKYLDPLKQEIKNNSYKIRVSIDKRIENEFNREENNRKKKYLKK